MRYLSIAEVSKKWGISERTVRNYCAKGRVADAKLVGKTWYIPQNAEKPARLSKTKPSKTILTTVREQRALGIGNGIYEEIQIYLTYSSGNLAHSTLSRERIQYLYENDQIGFGSYGPCTDPEKEAVNHFKCIDKVITEAEGKLTEKLIKQLHDILKNDVGDTRQVVGEYKTFQKDVSRREKYRNPDSIDCRMRRLLEEYHALPVKKLEDIVEFHVRFEQIHPFQDGNGRIGRLLLLKECLKYNIIPIIIEVNLQQYYLKGLREWPYDRSFLIRTCESAQYRFQAFMDKNRIPY